MPVNYSTTTITLNPAWRVTGRGMGDVFSGIMAAGNGTTNYGIVREGTILARHSGTDLMHPCGAQELTVFGSLNLLTMHDARNFYVSDVVSVYDSSGNVKAAARNVTIVDKTDPTHTVTVDGAAITIAAGDVILKDNEQIGRAHV